jgi:hypothetical protein
MSNPNQDDRAVLLREIEAFLFALPKPMAETTFGRMAVNDGKFVGRLRRQQNVTVNRIERCRSYMRNWRSAGARAA